jgi:predicted amidophosphoribosyltransferase
MSEERTCPACGGQVEDTDTVCPHCGEPLVGG